MRTLIALRAWFVTPSGQDLGDTAAWRSGVLGTMLRVVFVLGLITAVPSVILSIGGGLSAIAALDVVAMIVVGILALRADLPYRWRVYGLLAIAYTLGVVFLLTIGITSQLYLMAVPALTALLLGLRPAMLAITLSSLTLFLVGLLADARLDIAALDGSPVIEWAVIALNFAFVSAIITVSTAVLLDRLERSIDRQRATLTSLEAEVRSRRDAEESAERLARAVEQAREGILISDVAGRIVYANRAYLAMAGVDGIDVPGGPVRDVPIASEDAGLLSTILGHGRDWSGAVALTRADGQTMELDAIVSPILDAEGRLLNVVAVLRDDSKERQLEGRLRQAEKLEAIGTLAGGVAHDFNNIIGSILAVAEGSQDAATDDVTLRKNLAHIITASHRARDIVRQMLLFSRRSSREPRSVIVRGIVEEAAPLLRAAIPTTIELRTDVSTDAAVVADPAELHQVLMNLATNAAHAMAAGGTLTISVTALAPGDAFMASHPGLQPGERYVRLAVSDTGTGIDPAIAERIFEPFFTTKDAGDGTGLGLATVHGIVTALGGVIDVYSEPNRGTTFRAYLPEVEAPSPEPVAAPPLDDLSGNGHVLLVDDEEAILIMTQRLLVRLGYDVTIASDGLTAVALFEDEPSRFDLLLTDLTMPGLDGAGLIRAAHALRPELPTILSSGFSDSMEASERAALGITRFLQKPYTRLELATAVLEALPGRPGVETSAPTGPSTSSVASKPSSSDEG